MKSFLTTCSLLFVGLFLYGQANIQLSGTVLDKESQVPIEYSSVSLFLSTDSTLLDGVVTDLNGRFGWMIPKDQEVFIRVEFMGYQPYESEPFSPTKNRNFGKIFLEVDPKILTAVEVTGREVTSLYQLDKQVFDAGQFQNTVGGTATDVLGNLPSVSINANGEISIRGNSGFIILINGKAVQTDPQILLNQIPANSIEDIEIITAPSAKYDPDGGAGIINIKTRQGSTDGIFLVANLLWGLPSIEAYDNAESARRYGADMTMNWRFNKWDIALGLDYRRNDVSGRRVGYVNTYLNQQLTEFPSFGERSFDREQYSARASLLFTPDDRQSIGASFYAGKRTQFRTADILYDQQQRTFIPEYNFLDSDIYWKLYNASGEVFSGGDQQSVTTYFNENLRVRRGDFLIGALDYTYTWSDNSSLSLSALYEHTILGGPTDNINLAWPNTADTLQLQFNDNDNPLDGLRLKADYARSIGDVKWESGYQFRFLSHPGDFIYLDRDFDNNEWQVNPEFTNGIDLRRSIHSLYTQFSGKWKKWEYTAGLRLEYFDRVVAIESPDTTYNLSRLNPFPSINLLYDLGNDLKFKAAYSRRIGRTTTFKMTPFPEREHSETLEQGDAELLPEYIDLLEVGLVKNWKDHSFAANLYYRGISNVINRVNTIYNDTILNRIYTNAGNARALGLELAVTYYPVKWWRMVIGTNIYDYSIEGQLFEESINTSNLIYSINTTSTFSISSSFNIQLGLNYLSERVTAQGRDSRFFNPNLSIRKSFFDKKLALTFQWLNIDMGLWEANEQRITTVRSNFFTTTNYIYEVDILQLGLSYQFNQPSKNVKLLNSEFGDKEF